MCFCWMHFANTFEAIIHGGEPLKSEQLVPWADDEQGGGWSTPKCKVFRFHETILSFGDWIPRVGVFLEIYSTMMYHVDSAS